MFSPPLAESIFWYQYAYRNSVKSIISKRIITSCCLRKEIG